MRYFNFSVSYKGETSKYLKGFIQSCGARYDTKSKMWFMPSMPLGDLRDFLMKYAAPKSIISCVVQGQIC